MKITFKRSGKVVELVDEYGPEQAIRSAELADIPAEPSYAETLLLNISSVMVAVKTVDGKTIEEISGNAVKARDMLVAFRRSFTEGEWRSLVKTINETFDLDPNPEEVEIATS